MQFKWHFRTKNHSFYKKYHKKNHLSRLCSGSYGIVPFWLILKRAFRNSLAIIWEPLSLIIPGLFPCTRFGAGLWVCWKSDHSWVNVWPEGLFSIRNVPPFYFARGTAECCLIGQYWFHSLSSIIHRDTWPCFQFVDEFKDVVIQGDYKAFTINLA